MPAYGAALEWSTINAAHLCSGICENYTYDLAVEEDAIPGEVDIAAFAYHGKKADIAFDCTFDNTSTDFLDLTNGQQLAITGLSSGIVLATEAVETWAMKQPKKGSIKAVHLVDATGTGTAAGTLSALSPTSTAIVIKPTSRIIYGTAGLSHAAGYIIKSVSDQYKVKNIRCYKIQATWAPCLAS